MAAKPEFIVGVKHLIVVAHPLESSVTLKLARAYILELEILGHEWVMHDLYRLGFDPVMGPNELEPPAGHVPAPGDVRAAQAAITGCEVLTVVCPLWWAGMPAILKGYIDRVFSRGFAYEARAGQTRALLSGRRCIIVTLSGSPLSLLHENGEWSAIQVLQDLHIFRSCGFELVEHLHYELVEPPVQNGALKAHMDRIRHCARRHFSSPRALADSEGFPANRAGPT